MIIFIVFLPLLGFLYCAFFSKYFNDNISQLVTTIFLFISSFLSWIVFIQYLGGSDVKVINLINWMTLLKTCKYINSYGYSKSKHLFLELNNQGFKN